MVDFSILHAKTILLTLFFIWLQYCFYFLFAEFLMFVKSQWELWSAVWAKDTNLGTIFHSLIVSATATRKVGSKYHKMLNSVCKFHLFIAQNFF